MKKLLFALPIVLLLAVGCNSSQQAAVQTPAPAPIVQNTNQAPTPAQTSSSKNQNIYFGSNFTFQYPSDWLVSSTGNPAKNSASCGDAWGDAASCINLDPPELAKNMTNTVTVFVYNTNVSPQTWCQSRNTGEYGTTFDNCQAIVINGYSAVTASSPSGDLPVIQYKIIQGDGTLLVFQTANQTYISTFYSIAGSVTFNSTTQTQNWKDTVLNEFSGLTDWQQSSPSGWQFADYTYETQHRSQLKTYGTGTIFLLSKSFNGNGCQSDCSAEGNVEDNLIASVKATLSQNGWTAVSWPTEPYFYTDYLYAKDSHPLILQVGTRDAVTGGMYVNLEFQY
jgi:hypothetical protein